MTRHELYQSFQHEFPISTLKDMDIEKYTGIDNEDTFCHWLESTTNELGSIWGGSAYKFGVFKYDKDPNLDNSKYNHDKEYSWSSRLGNTAMDAYQKVLKGIVEIANLAKDGYYDKIDDIDVVWPSVKWKIAFLYSDEKLLPIYAKDKFLVPLAKLYGMKNAKKAKQYQIYDFLLQKKGNQDIYEFSDELLSKVKDDEPVKVDTHANDNEHKSLPKYDRSMFLNDVFMSGDEYDSLRNLLEYKQNVILQGAPGVGKTFCAKRLAYSIMGVKDDDRVAMVQFHQNYSYEDFIMGYRPEGNGFVLKKGIFYKFCKKAGQELDKPYFFIIDEINRGNLSKIFGELLMLIEKDYRGEEIRMAYNDEPFSVPANLYIIGMMNTADRSLAMIDYALRRRFSFFNMKPAFDSDGFQKYQLTINDETFNKVIDGIKNLNDDIKKDNSLGEGFCIGHSYLCGGNITKERLASIIDYDIKPMIREYWFDNDAKYQEESDKLDNLLK